MEIVEYPRKFIEQEIHLPLTDVSERERDKESKREKEIKKERKRERERGRERKRESE